MASVLAACAVDHGFKLRSSQIKEYKIGSYSSTVKQVELVRKSKDLARNQDNVSEWSYMSIRGLLFQYVLGPYM